MKSLKICILTASLAALIDYPCFSDDAAVAPTSATQPATTANAATPAPAKVPGYSIQGAVKISSGLTLESPDLTHVVVYLASAPALDAVVPPANPAIMAQHNKAFEPDFVVISKGRGVDFPNWDHFEHNVFSRSKAAPAFDLLRYRYGQSKSRTFDKTGPIQLFCNIHPDMRGLIYVAPNPFFARPDSEGHFEIRDVPAGSYDLVVWSQRCKEIHQAVTVGGSAGSEPLTLTLAEDRGAIMANDPPKSRNAYSVERGLNMKRERLDLPAVQDQHAAPTPPPGD
jgi:plastocyanin